MSREPAGMRWRSGALRLDEKPCECPSKGTTDGSTCIAIWTLADLSVQERTGRPRVTYRHIPPLAAAYFASSSITCFVAL